MSSILARLVPSAIVHTRQSLARCRSLDELFASATRLVIVFQVDAEQPFHRIALLKRPAGYELFDSSIQRRLFLQEKQEAAATWAPIGRLTLPLYQLGATPPLRVTTQLEGARSRPSTNEAHVALRLYCAALPLPRYLAMLGACPDGVVQARVDGLLWCMAAEDVDM